MYRRTNAERGGRMLIRPVGIVLMLCGLWYTAADAACSGSGLSWTCPAGETQANIQSAITSATDGGTITLAAGTYSFRRVRLDNNGNKGITIICATAPLTRGAASSSPCTLTDDQPFWMAGTGSITKMVRVSGFRFTNSTGGPNFSYGFNSGDPALTSFRIDHNTFLAQSGYTIALGFQSAAASKWGVIDHNSFDDTTGGSAQMIFYGAGDTDWGLGVMAGTANAVYIEDNDFTYTAERLAGSGGDGSNGGAQVWRYNNITNSRPAVHGRCHNGPVNFEVYNNTIDSSDGYRVVHHQGCGEMIVFGNTITPNTASMALQHYRSSNPNPEGCGTCDGLQVGDGNRSPTATYRGYPCEKQPARTGGGVYRPVYTWNNRYGNGNLIQLNIEDAGGTTFLAQHMVAGRDHFQASTLTVQSSASSPFNGNISSNGGIGYGTLANRPTTCETSSETAFGNGAAGAGYFATDVGSQGTLYTCSATNTWSVYYTPYTYPHPLVGGGEGGGGGGPSKGGMDVRDRRFQQPLNAMVSNYEVCCGAQ